MKFPGTNFSADRLGETPCSVVGGHQRCRSIPTTVVISDEM